MLILRDMKLSKKVIKMNVLDLFCGAGGLASGFSKNKFTVTGIDKSTCAVETFKLNNFGEAQEINLQKETVKGDFDIIIGGPPCKPWSSVNVSKRKKDHSDYNLITSYFENVIHHQPKIFIMENVLPVSKDEILKHNINRMRNRGYSIQKVIVKYSNYGAATSRRRLFVIGRKGRKVHNLVKDLEKKKSGSQTVGSAIRYLNNKESEKESEHIWPNLKTIHKYREYYKTGKFGWYILDWNKPSPSFGNVMKTYILHPDGFNRTPPRVISVRETLNIMGFDNNFKFPDQLGMGIKYQLAVDAVSPVFSNILAQTVRKFLEEKEG